MASAPHVQKGLERACATSPLHSPHAHDQPSAEPQQATPPSPPPPSDAAAPQLREPDRDVAPTCREAEPVPSASSPQEPVSDSAPSQQQSSDSLMPSAHLHLSSAPAGNRRFDRPNVSRNIVFAGRSIELHDLLKLHHPARHILRCQQVKPVPGPRLPRRIGAKATHTGAIARRTDDIAE